MKNYFIQKLETSMFIFKSFISKPPVLLMIGCISSYSYAAESLAEKYGKSDQAHNDYIGAIYVSEANINTYQEFKNDIRFNKSLQKEKNNLEINYIKDQCSQLANIEMIGCLQDLANDIYNQIEIEENKYTTAKAKKAFSAWRNYAATQCEAISDTAGQGSLAPALYARCSVQLNQDYLNTLSDLY